MKEVENVNKLPKETKIIFWKEKNNIDVNEYINNYWFKIGFYNFMYIKNIYLDYKSDKIKFSKCATCVMWDIFYSKVFSNF